MQHTWVGMTQLSMVSSIKDLLSASRTSSFHWNAPKPSNKYIKHQNLSLNYTEYVRRELITKSSWSLLTANHCSALSQLEIPSIPSFYHAMPQRTRSRHACGPTIRTRGHHALIALQSGGHHATNF